MLLLYNGKILGECSFFESVLISDRILDLGSSRQMLRNYPDVDRIDLQGRLVLPGFNDSHMHLLNYAMIKSQLQLFACRSVDEVIALGKQYAIKRPKVIIGRGYNDAIFIEKRPLTKDDLDQISKDIPIICYRVCGHIVSVNSKALEIARIDPLKKVEGGMIDLDSNNEPTGILRENAIGLVDEFFSKPSQDEMIKMLEDAIFDANRVGITSINTNDIFGDVDFGKEIIESYQSLLNQNKLNARINHQFTLTDFNEIDSLLKLKVDHPYLKIGPLKIFIDGSLGAKTAYLKQNYLGENHQGILCMGINELDNLLKYVNDAKVNAVIHAIGDQGIEICLNAFEKLDKTNKLRNGIIHVQITDLNILKRFLELKVYAIVQPIFINNDMEIVASRVGNELAKTSYAFKTLYESTNTCFGSDAPVEDFNPLLGIYASVTRSNLENTKVYNLNQRLEISEAIKAYTINNAYLSNEEDTKGLIKVGFYSDLVVLEEDLFTIDPSTIKDVKVNMTIVGGKIVYQGG